MHLAIQGPRFIVVSVAKVRKLVLGRKPMFKNLILGSPVMLQLHVFLSDKLYNYFGKAKYSTKILMYIKDAKPKIHLHRQLPQSLLPLFQKGQWENKSDM